MATLADELRTIKANVESLLAAKRQLERENVRLADENNRLKETVDIQKNTIKDLEEYNKIIKIAGVINLPKADAKELKLKINEYIREIDRCIARLSE